MDNKIWNDFIEYLRFLILSEGNMKNISNVYKPIAISYFFDSEVYGDGIQSYFEIWSSHFSLEEVLNAFRVLDVNQSLIDIIEIAKKQKYKTDDEIYAQALDDKALFEQLMEERDMFWDDINRRYYDIEDNDIEDNDIEDNDIEDNDIEERILEYINKNHLSFENMNKQ